MEKLIKFLDKIEQKISYYFKNKTLLSIAFTHRSFTNENKEFNQPHNERLEFLGDAVLGLLISEFLYKTMSNSDEGALSYLRSRIVDASSCASFIHELQVEEFLLLGKGEAMNAGRGRETILADLFEALLGAIYLDGGVESAKHFFFSHFEFTLKALIKEPSRNWKALLQDHFQKKYQKQPRYLLMNVEGPDHDRIFSMGVYMDDELLGSGSGSSKKEAEQCAAKDAYEKLEKE